MRQYRGKWVFPLARLFKALCHPSRSLFVLTASMNTLQVVGGNIAFNPIISDIFDKLKLKFDFVFFLFDSMSSKCVSKASVRKELKFCSHLDT